MKRLLLVLSLVVSCSVVYAAKPNAYWELVVDSGTIRDTAVGYSNPILVSFISDLSVLFSIDSGTSTSLKLEVQVVDSNSSNYSVIGSTNDTSVDPNYDVNFSSKNYTMGWASLQTGGTVVSAHTSGKIAEGVSLPVTKWMRFKVTGNAANMGVTTYSISVGRYSER